MKTIEFAQCVSWSRDTELLMIVEFAIFIEFDDMENFPSLSAQ